MNISPVLSNNLNFLRWLAALLVVIGHLRSLIFPDYTQLISPHIIEKLFYFITGLGHEAVIVFFVLSGYLVGGEFIKMKKTSKQYFLYFVKRFSRIFTVFIPALFFGGLLDYVGIMYFNSSGIYSNTYHFSAMNYNVIDRTSLDVLIANIFMMQTSLVPTYGSNGPLWSLANEWWYYILFPTLYFILFTQNIIMKTIFSLLLFFLIFILNNELLLYFSIWISGALAFIFRKEFNIPFIKLISFVLLILGFVVARTNLFENSFLQDIIIAITLIFLINNLSFIYLKEKNFKGMNKFLADFSYSLYLFHFPIAVLLIAISKTGNYNKVYMFLLFLIIIYFFSIGSYMLFEKNTYKVKSFLIKYSNRFRVTS